MTQERGSVPEGADLSVLVIHLLKGVLYREGGESRWATLLQLQPRIREYVAILGLDLIVDESEGYAFLRTRPADPEQESSAALPRLFVRRPLSFPVSLVLVLLRRKLAEFDAGGADTRLVLGRDEIVELVRVFLPGRTNEARLFDQIDGHINKVVELGFLRRLDSSGRTANYEVRRILKAFVDAQWLHDFDHRLAAYQRALVDEAEEAKEAEDA